MTRSLLLLIVALAVPVAWAQPTPPTPPRPPAPPVFDAARLDALFSRPPKVEVNLKGAMLGIASAATAESDPGAAEMLRNLRGITVRVYSLPELDPEVTRLRDELHARPDDADARARFEAAMERHGEAMARYGEEMTRYGEEMTRLTEQFQAEGWETMVRVRPGEGEEDDVSIFVRGVENGLDGMVVIAIDPEDGQAAFVFIDGRIDVAQLARLSDQFAGTDLEEADDAAREADDAAREADDAARESDEEAREADEEAREADQEAREADEEAADDAEDAAREAEEAVRQAEQAVRKASAAERRDAEAAASEARRDAVRARRAAERARRDAERWRNR